VSTPVSARSSTSTTPVFVDESGRRHRRVVWVARGCVTLLGAYVALVVMGFTTSLSFPIAHLGGLGALPRHANHETLGPSSRALAAPELALNSHDLAGVGSRTAAPTPRVAFGQTGFPFAAPAGMSPTTENVVTRVPATPTPTARPTTPPSTPPPPPTTAPRSHPTPTTHPHGPPSTVHGKGHQR
jgi:hypothetical protein